VEGKRRGKTTEKMGAGHQHLAGRRHCGRRERNGRQSSSSWTHPGSYVSQRYAELKKENQEISRNH